MIPKTDTFQLITATKDKFGKITESNLTTHDCYIERDLQYSVQDGAADVIGLGLIFSDEEALVDLAKVGDKVVIDGEEHYINRRYIGNDIGKFHHIELMYG